MHQPGARVVKVVGRLEAVEVVEALDAPRVTIPKDTKTGKETGYAIELLWN